MYKKVNLLLVSITSIAAFTGLTAYTHNYDHNRQQLEGESLTKKSTLQINVSPDISVDNPPVSSEPALQHEHEHQHEQNVAAGDVKQPQHNDHSHSDKGAATNEKTTRTRAS